MESTFSKTSRIEALDNYSFSKSDCCNISFLHGYFYRDEINADTKKIIHKPDIPKTVKTIKKLLKKYDIDSYIVDRELDGKNPVTKLYITDKICVNKLYNLWIENTHCEKCMLNFLTGVFISDGVLVNPEREYHLEFSYRDEKVAINLMNILRDSGFEFKLSKRKSSTVIYTKNSSTIEEFLVTVGAQNSCLELMSGKVVKDMRNHINRVTNCDAANIAKTIKSGQKYIKAINKLIETELLYDLPDDLQELAQLKIENPELSLSDLGKLCTEPMTKSSVNRRLQKLCAIAQIEE